MSRTTAPPDTGGSDRITFDCTRELQRAMKVARSIVGRGTRKYSRLVGCRLYAPEGHAQIQVLATDGRRMTRVRVAASRRHADRRLDHALHPAVLRQLAETKAAVVQIEPEADRTWVREGDGPMPWTLHDPGESHSVCTYERVFDAVRPKVSATLLRSRAIEALRDMTPQARGSACRIEIDATKVRAWGTDAKKADGVLVHEVELARDVRGETPMVIGVIRDELAATLRTLIAPKATLSFEGPDRGVQLVTDDGLQTALLASARLA